jgi:hypothetical protein
MYGRDIGALNVYIKMKDGNKTVIFSKNKDIGVPDWWKSVLNINAYDSYQVCAITENLIYIKKSIASVSVHNEHKK